MQHSRMRCRIVAATAAAGVVALAGVGEAAGQTVTSLEEPSSAYAEPFSLIGGIRELDDGRVLVSDVLEEALYALDPGLTAAEKISKKGQGPDEYRQPDALFAWPGDSTLLVDLGNGRMTVIGPDYGFGRTIPVVQQEGMGLSIVIPEGVDGEGRLYYQPRGDGEIRDSADIVRWAPGSGTPDPVVRVKLTDVKQRTSGGAGEVRQEVMPVPLSPEDGWDVGADGAVAVVRSGDYHVDWVRPDGSITSGSAVALDAVPIREADKEAWAEELAASGMMMMVTNDNGQLNANMRRGGGRTPTVDRFEWPEVKPPFDPESVRIDPLGYVWVERHVPAGDRPVLDVFDATGDHVAAVTIPARCSLRAFGDGTLYLSRWDDLGFQWLERYARPTI
ncbi:MAG: hypothetical protein Q8W45_02855 [Candidatus Palauibacterales bacterium]|nr:hypothetical protein [Candidatus Palauibacterales bacterium]MDP2482197.1 hypothetical protein [Candidatus Palauibacterales bacterium]